MGFHSRQADIFADCESLDDILFLTLDQGGHVALQELLNQCIADNSFGHETYLDAAASLEAAGLPMGANLIREAAEQLKDKVSPEIVVVLEDDNRANVKAGLANLNRRGELKPADWQYIEE
jgi:hypothetical protein